MGGGPESIATAYDVQLNAARVGFAADSSALMRQRTDFYGCAERGNKYGKKMRRQFLTDIDNRRAELATITATAIAVLLASAVTRVWPLLATPRFWLAAGFAVGIVCTFFSPSRLRA